MYRVKIGTEYVYKYIDGKYKRSLLKKAERECSKTIGFKILEIETTREIKNKRLEIEAFLKAETKEDCYKSLKNSILYRFYKNRFNKEQYQKIKRDIKEIKYTTNTLEEQKEKYQKYLKTLQKQGI